MFAPHVLNFDSHNNWRMTLFEFLNQNALFVVLIIALVVWFGIYLYLFRIDGKLTKLEKRNLNQKEG
jgi:CcmD family protein